jgi:hypothetical protein
MTQETLPPIDIGAIRYRITLPARSFASYVDMQRLVLKKITQPLLSQRRIMAMPHALPSLWSICATMSVIPAEAGIHDHRLSSFCSAGGHRFLPSQE